MKHFTKLSLSTAFAALVIAPAAHADVTADQVWQSWVDYYGGIGQTISADKTEKQGDTLVVSGVKIVAKLPDGGTSEGVISEIRLQEMGDGTVTVTPPAEVPFTMKPAAKDGVTPPEMKMVFAQTGATTLVSGTPEAMSYAFTAPEFSMAMDEAGAAATDVPPVKMKATVKNATGTYLVEKKDGQAITQDMKADSLDLALTGADPQGSGTFNMTGTMTGLAGKGTMTLPTGVAMSDMNAAMKAGMSIIGDFSYGSGVYKIEGSGADGNFTVDTKGGAGKLDFKMASDGIAYGAEIGENTMSVTGPMPFPVEASVGQSAFKIAMPVSKADTASPASFLVKLVDLKLSDALWNMFDPGSQLPRDPATLVLDISGSIKPLMDLFDPANAAAGANPFEVEAAKINALQLKAVGAELTGTGDVTFDNSAGTPKPLGMVDLKLTGATALMQKLGAMGLIPQEQIMGAQMMLGMFTVPAGEDAVTSKIEFKEDGGIYANGQRLQ